MDLCHTVHGFIVTNCPRFRKFSSVHKPGSTSVVLDIDIQMHLVHLEFKELVEKELHEVVKALGTTEERIVALLDTELVNGDETATRLYELLTTYQDFFKFGAMMQRKCEELYPPSSAHSSSASSTKQLRICRVLWDLENVPVDSALGGMGTVEALQGYLRSMDLMGGGIDTRITAFFNPFNKSISKKVIEELNKASVELVCASAKREDADRKLGMRINQEMQLLTAELTTFVIISSDQDFRQHIQLLSNAGYRTIVMHEARSENWRKALELHADEGVLWSTVLSSHPAGTTPPVEEGEPSRQPASPADGSYTSDVKIKRKDGPVATVDGIMAPPEATPTTTEQIIHQRDTGSEAAAVGWRVAVCQRWASAYGFLLVDISHSAVTSDFQLPSPARLQDPDIAITTSSRARGNRTPADNAGERSTVKVYVHHSALTHKPAGQRLLKAGEYVLAEVVMDSKGPKAVVVKDLFSISASVVDSDVA